MFLAFKRLSAKSKRKARSAPAFASLLPSVPSPLPNKKKAVTRATEAKKTSVPKKPRAGLGETIRTIKAGGLPLSPASALAKMGTARGASFRTAVYASDQGERSYKLYLPSTYRIEDANAASLPLVVMLHGCTQSPDDFAAATRMNSLAEEFGLIVAYPSQPREANANRCWNWYKRGDQARDIGEPALIAGITRLILDNHRVDPARVYVAGLSAGGSAAAVLGGAYPDLFAAIGVHSGLAAGAAHDAASGLIAMRHGAPGDRPTAAVPTIVFHGDADHIVNPGNGRYVAARAIVPFPPLSKTIKRLRAPGGRYYSRTTYRAHNRKAYVEHWVVEGAGHAWAGGSPAGSFSDPMGPEASRAMVKFFLRHRTTIRRRKTTTRP